MILRSSETFAPARRTDLTTYDAAYFWLARTHDPEPRIANP